MLNRIENIKENMHEMRDNNTRMITVLDEVHGELSAYLFTQDMEDRK